MFGNDREAMRAVYARVWAKMEADQALEPLETIIASALRAHPEYSEVVSDPAAMTQEFGGTNEASPTIVARSGPRGGANRASIPRGGETEAVNPYLHLGLHVALHEQLQIDRPVGIRGLYQDICRRMGDVHQAEHAMMACLMQAMASSREPAQMDAQLLDSLRSLAK